MGIQLVRALRTLIGLNGLDQPEVHTHTPDHVVQGRISAQPRTRSSGLSCTVGVLVSSSATATALPGHVGPSLARSFSGMLAAQGLSLGSQGGPQCISTRTGGHCILSQPISSSGSFCSCALLLSIKQIVLKKLTLRFFYIYPEEAENQFSGLICLTLILI